MNRDEMEGKWEKAKGYAKDKAGEAIGDPELEAEGEGQRAAAAAQETAGEARREAGEIVEDAGEATEDAGEKIKGD